VAPAQAAPPITPSGLNSQVSAPLTLASGQVQYDITGGTRPGNGVNLFHSFGDFGVPTNNIGNFLNDSGLATSNILGRVTGGNIANIFGTIQTTSFGGANLFLMNPAGFLFGPNATVNVGGMVAFTSADYLKLADNARFNAIPNAGADALLTALPVASFGFLGSNPGAITVQGSQFMVTEGTGISLVGGDITIQSGVLEDGITVQPARLAAPGGQINLASVASPGEILYPSLDTAANVNGQSFTTLGSITLSEGSVLDVSANAAGAVKILGGQFVIDSATISADTVDADGAPVAININVTGDMSVIAIDVQALTARTTGSGDAGELRISTDNMDVTATTLDNFLFPVMDTHTSGPGKAGNVTITTGDLAVTGDPFGLALFIDSGTAGQGHGGDVTITAQSVQMQDTFVSTGNFVSTIFGEDVTGAAGNVAISADSVHLTFSGIDTNSFSFENNTGQAGDISVTARDIQLETSLFQAQGYERGGAITVNADRVLLSDSRFETQTILTPGGGIAILANTVDLTQGSQLISATGGDGDAGSIHVTASEHIGILEGSRFVRPSGIFTQSFGALGSLGNAGDVIITTPQLQMTGGGRINTVTKSSGRGGNVTINAADSVSISGEFPDEIGEPLFNLGPIHQSGIFTSTVGGNCPGPCGDAGHISITTSSLMMGNGSQIDSGTSSNGNGGLITINASDTISMSGRLSDSSPVGILSRTIGTALDSGGGGNIALTAGQSITISNGASISASSTGLGDAGNIAINAGQQFDMRNSSVKTESAQAGGGNIDIQAVDRIRLVNSTVSTSVLGGAGSGGNITIDPNIVVLQNSQVIAQAVQGAGGNITITTPLFLADQTSFVSASSQFGLNGTVTIQNPTSNISESLGALTSEPSQAQSLLTQRCAAMANGQASSFVVAGREQLPADPGSWLTSPLAFAALGESHGASDAVASVPAVMAMAAQDSGTVSLRRLTPAGFLIANFADSEATGCHS
jgi:filamentous hemagglutinin family protein